MTTIMIKRNANKFTNSPEIRSTGKAGRRERMFEASRRIKSAVDFKPKSTAAEKAVALSALPKRKLIDVANYRCCKKQNKPLTAHGKQKRQLSCKAPLTMT